MYTPFWDKTQELRQQDQWINRAGWLSDSPQCRLEWYNPIVQSKMFMLNAATMFDEADNEYYYWLDAGITSTVPEGHLSSESVLGKLHKLTEEQELLFLSFPYKADQEVHGFEFNAINTFAKHKVEYVCRGGLFGGHRDTITLANDDYYNTLDATLREGYMGTEESIFTIMSYNNPSIYRRYSLDENGIFLKLTEALSKERVGRGGGGKGGGGGEKRKEKGKEKKKKKINESVELEEVDKVKVVRNNILDKVKTNLYMLTFNLPEQLLHTIATMEKTDNLLEHPSLYLFDNSTDPDAMVENERIAKLYGFEYMHQGSNTGICRGRQSIAEHFHESDADYMLFFEDDMTFNSESEEGKLCRSGFRTYAPNIYNTIHKIIDFEDLDFLKLSFSEVYSDNDTQCAWYNVPQDVRESYWPEYNQLPIQGLDSNCPKVEYKTINKIDDLSYAIGDVYFCNWPLLVSKEGNKKMFIDTKFDNPFEQTMMSHIFQLTKEEKVRPAVLLASPIWHDRIKFYEPKERREN